MYKTYKYAVDPFIVSVAIIISWLMAAAYRVYPSSFSLDYMRVNYGVAFVVCSMIGFNYLIIRYRPLFALSAAVLSASFSYFANADKIHHSLKFTIASFVTIPLCVGIATLIQRSMENYPIWEMVFVMHEFSCFTHAVVFNMIARYGESDQLEYIYGSISSKMLLEVFSLPFLLYALSLSGMTITNSRRSYFGSVRET